MEILNIACQQSTEDVLWIKNNNNRKQTFYNCKKSKSKVGTSLEFLPVLDENVNILITSSVNSHAKQRVLSCTLMAVYAF